MKKLILCLMLVSAFGFCFAPINMGEVPAGMKKPELSEAERAKQQNHLPQIGEVGIVPEKDNAPIMPTTVDDPSAQQTVAGALDQRKDSPKASESAKDDLIKADQTMKSAKADSKFGMLFWAAIFAVLGFGIVLGVRKYVDKVVPDVPKKKKVNW
jgi:hypothetical protein